MMAERFWTKVLVTEDCWIWTAARLATGYGLWHPPKASGRKMGVAHRFAFEAMVGPIPEGLQLDHLCRTPGCVKPTHLEPVTHQENQLRRRGVKDECRQGHDLNAANKYIRADGSYQCRACNREYVRAKRAAKRVAA